MTLMLYEVAFLLQLQNTFVLNEYPLTDGVLSNLSNMIWSEYKSVVIYFVHGEWWDQLLDLLDFIVLDMSVSFCLEPFATEVDEQR